MNTVKKISRYWVYNLKLHHIILILFLLLTSQGCSKIISQMDPPADRPSFITKSDFLLNTIITINIYDQQNEVLLSDCFDLIAHYEKIYSRTDEDSELYRLNHQLPAKNNQPYPISSELSDLLRQGLNYSKLSQGAFDITIAPISSLWNFKTSTPSLPDKAAIQAALPSVNYKNVALKDNDLSFHGEIMGFDLGAIAKGYIADKIKDFLISKGVKSAIINLGGNILCIGSKPDGSPFTIGVQKPFADRNETIGSIDIRDMSVVTSGIYERYITVDDVIYHHILNPKTGYPYENDLISVTILSHKSVDGDGLSTSCFALGLEKGLALVESLPQTYAIFITNNYDVVYSKGLMEAIPLHITLVD
jgi:thiamine biosynthesis lipoprotein